MRRIVYKDGEQAVGFWIRFDSVPPAYPPDEKESSNNQPDIVRQKVAERSSIRKHRLSGSMETSAFWYELSR